MLVEIGNLTHEYFNVKFFHEVRHQAMETKYYLFLLRLFYNIHFIFFFNSDQFKVINLIILFVCLALVHTLTFLLYLSIMQGM